MHTTHDIDVHHEETPQPSGSRLSRNVVWRLVNGIALLVVIAGAGVLLVPHLLGYDRYVIVGGSMEPTIHRGSVVFAEDIPVSALTVGDVITYKPPADSGIHSLVTHRIADIGTADDGSLVFQTKGDANDAADPWHFELLDSRQNVVRHKIPFLGNVLLALSNPRFRMLIIGIPAGLIALQALVELIGIELRIPRRARALG